MHEAMLIAHATFGVAGVMAAVWAFVEVLNLSETNGGRVRAASVAVVTFMWAACFLGGYWYLTYFAPDKALILKGPWPFAHTFFMETKEHLFFILLLLASYFPICVFENELTPGKAPKSLLLTIAGLIVVLGMGIDGAGAIISMGVRMSLGG